MEVLTDQCGSFEKGSLQNHSGNMLAMSGDQHQWEQPFMMQLEYFQIPQMIYTEL